MDQATLWTWNVAGLDDRRLDERTEQSCLAVLLREPRPHLIALQELVHRSWHAHWKHHLRAAGYTVFPTDPSATDAEYFTALAVSGAGARGGSQRFPGTRMGRSLVWAEVGDWLVLTAHLESERGGGLERVAQAEQIARRLADHAGPAVFGGDTNLRVEEEARIPSLAEVTDAWAAVGSPAKARATWLGGRVGARFDRVWHNARLQTRGLRLEVPVDEVGRLSDHAAVVVDLARPG